MKHRTLKPPDYYPPISKSKDPTRPDQGSPIAVINKAKSGKVKSGSKVGAFSYPLFKGAGSGTLGGKKPK